MLMSVIAAAVLVRRFADPSNASQSTVSGMPSLDTAGTGTVSVRDSVDTGPGKNGSHNSDGAYTFDVRGSSRLSYSRPKGPARPCIPFRKAAAAQYQPALDTAVAAQRMIRIERALRHAVQ